MLNPNEIAGKKFDKAMGRGYKVEEVERFLATVADEMNDLLVDKQEVEQKLLVLADKLEEYKHDEESLRAALLGAQKLGDSVVRDAKARAGMIIDEANTKAALMLEAAKKEIERQQNGFARMQREVATFKSKLQLVYKQHLELISSIPVDESILKAAMAVRAEETSPAPAPAAPVPLTYEEPQAAEQESEHADVYSIPLPADTPLEYSEEELEYLTEENGYESDTEPEKPSRRESRFGPLKFGKEFDIKRDNDKRKK